MTTTEASTGPVSEPEKSTPAPENITPSPEAAPPKPEPHILRQAGRFEHFHIARSALKLYKNVIVGANYSSPHSLTLNKLTLALARVIKEHPILACGVLQEKGSPPSFIRLPEIDFSKNIQWDSSSVAQNHYREYAALITQLHNTHFEDIETLPLWRVAVLKRSYNYPTAWNSEANSDGRIEYEILFCYHHAIADGMSGAAFHYSLLKALNNIDPDTTGGVDKFKPAEDIELLPSMDDVVDLSLGVKTAGKIVGYIGKALLPKFVQKNIWAAGNVPMEIKPTKIKMFVMDKLILERFLPVLKRYKVSMTSFLTYAVAASLFDAVSKYDKENDRKLKAVRVSIPVSFRKHAGWGSDVMTDCVSAINWDIDRFKSISSATSGMKKLTQALKAGSENSRDSEIGLLKLVPDMEGYFKGQLGKPRDLTFEVSNLGVLDNSKLGWDPKEGKGTYSKESRNEMKEAEWRIDEVLFSQGASVTGPAFTVNVATVRGKMVYVVQWMHGVIDDDLIEAVGYRIQGQVVELSK